MRISLEEEFQLETPISRKRCKIACFAIFGSYGSVFGNFLGVRGVTFCDIFALICPWEWWRLRRKKNLLFHQKWAWNSNFCELNFQEFCLKWWRKELFLHCGDELSDCNCGGIFLMDKPFLKLGHYSAKANWRGPLNIFQERSWDHSPYSKSNAIRNSIFHK